MTLLILLTLISGCGKGALKFSGVSGVTTDISGLSDDFNDNQRNTVKWDLFGGTGMVSETNQRLEIALPTSPGPVTWGYGDFSGYWSKNSYDMEGGNVSFELVQADTAGNVGDTEILLTKSKLNLDDYFSLWIYNGRIGFDEIVGGVWGNSGFDIAYDPVQHRYLRISHQIPGNTVTVEGSPDNIVWASLGSLTPALSMDNLYLALTGIIWGVDATPGTAIFDNVVLETSN